MAGSEAPATGESRRQQLPPSAYRHRASRRLYKAPLHSIGATSRLAALLLGHKCPNLLPRRALRRPGAALLRPDLGTTRGSTTGCYALTVAGRRQLVKATEDWRRTSALIERVLAGSD